MGPNYTFEHLWSQLAALAAKKADPLNLNIGPWDTHPSKYGACLWRMDMCK